MGNVIFMNYAPDRDPVFVKSDDKKTEDEKEAQDDKEAKDAKEAKNDNFDLTLPPEIMCLIISFLDAVSLVQVSKVCTQWCKLVKDHSNPATTGHLSIANPPLSSFNLKSESKVLLRMLRLWPNIKTLEVDSHSLKVIKQSIFATFVSKLEKITVVVDEEEPLGRWEKNILKKMCEYDYDEISNDTYYILEATMDPKNLESFSIKDVTRASIESGCHKEDYNADYYLVRDLYEPLAQMTNLRFLRIDFFYFEEHRPSEIQKDNSTWSYEGGFDYDSDGEEYEPVTDEEEEDDEMLYSSKFEDIFRYIPNEKMEHLYLGFRDRHLPEPYDRIILDKIDWDDMKPMPNLVQITIDSFAMLHCSEFRSLNILLEKYPNLKKLVLKSQFNIYSTGDDLVESLSSLLAANPNLKHLTLSFGPPIKQNNVVIKRIYRWAVQDGLPNEMSFVLKEEIGPNVLTRIYKYPSMRRAIYVQPKLRFKEYKRDSCNEIGDSYNEDDVASNSVDEDEEESLCKTNEESEDASPPKKAKIIDES